MIRTISFTIALLAVVATAGVYLLGTARPASADGIYNPNNIEDTYNVYYPGAMGPCNNGLDDDYDGYADALDSDCLDPKPPATATNTPAPVNTPTQPPTATQGPPSLGGVAAYPDVSSGGASASMALLIATAMLLSGGAGILAWRRLRP
jgi:hypothetical protein